jgi:hypothetical protein
MRKIRRAATFSWCTLIWLGCQSDNPVDSVNDKPVLLAINANPITIAPNGTSDIALDVIDQDGDALTVTYSASGGTIVGDGGTAIFTADSAEGVKGITVKINDGRGGEVSGSASINVTKNPALITIAVQLLEQSASGTQCLLFRAQAAEELLLQGIQIINPNNESILNPIAAGTLSKGVPVSLQARGLCYTKRSGTYRFILTLIRPGTSDAFTFETTYIQP